MKRLKIDFVNGTYYVISHEDWTDLKVEDGFLVVTDEERQVLLAPIQNVCCWTFTEVTLDG